MAIRKKWAVVGAIVILMGVSGALFFMRRDKASPLSASQPFVVHYGGAPSIPIKAVRVKAFYFVPSDRSGGWNPAADGWRGASDDAWRAAIGDALASLKKFWEFQLHNAVTVTVDLYPVVVIGKENHLFYGGMDTGRGNPDGFRLVKGEILARVFTPGGDLYDESFVKVSQDEYKVMGILYEGDAAAASMLEVVGTQDAIALLNINAASSTGETAIVDETDFPAFFVARWYVAGGNRAEYGLSMLSHEFGHTLGLRDDYDLKTGEPLSDDIMGAGRFRPLEITYLGDAQKTKLGFTQ